MMIVEKKYEVVKGEEVEEVKSLLSGKLNT